MSKQTKLLQWIYSVPSCDPSIDWLISFKPALSLQQAWSRCPNGLWMLWGLSKINLPYRVLMSAALVIAEGVQHNSEYAKKINKLTRKYIGRHLSKQNFLKQVSDIIWNNIEDYGSKGYYSMRAAESVANICVDRDRAADPFSWHFMLMNNCEAEDVPHAKEMADRIRKVVPFSLVKNCFERTMSRKG